jgi:hypothetical protein
MNHILKVCAEYAGLLGRCIYSFRPAALHRTGGGSLSTEIASENSDEMLVAMPWAVANFRSAHERQVAQLTQKGVSPFGDW